ncbi:MAG TPA: dTDP-4-dehydrorhamnose 3,5-epimerase, partial [Hyphomicrobium sp.]|nr:dTDP-4-dehydrorhamnose 3,5-epimerase [Hyphomicrobium sp.]
KLVRVTAGAIFDVIVDVRAGSATYGRWFGVELSAANRRQLYIPQGFAHGFQTLVADTEVTYHISVPYAPEHADGLIWNDPDIGIRWPAPDAAVLSERDASLKPLADFEPVTC